MQARPERKPDSGGGVDLLWPLSFQRIRQPDEQTTSDAGVSHGHAENQATIRSSRACRPEPSIRDCSRRPVPNAPGIVDLPTAGHVAAVSPTDHARQSPAFTRQDAAVLISCSHALHREGGRVLLDRSHAEHDTNAYARHGFLSAPTPETPSGSCPPRFVARSRISPTPLSGVRTPPDDEPGSYASRKAQTRSTKRSIN